MEALQTVHLVAPPRCVDVSHGSKRRLDAAGYLPEQSLKVAHPPLVDDDPPSLVVRVTVAKHKNVLDDGLRQKVGLF